LDIILNVKIYSNDNKYDGEYKDGIRDDEGIFNWADGDKYEGEFKGVLECGKEMLFYAEGNWYEGEL